MNTQTISRNRVQNTYFSTLQKSRSSIVVSTLRCGRRNPSSIPGIGNIFFDFFACLENSYISEIQSIEKFANRK